MQELSRLKEEVEVWDALIRDVADLQELAALGGDDAMQTDLQQQFDDVQRRFQQLEFQTVFSGEYDHSSCIVVLTAGAGGVDAQDWTSMLLRMYLRYAERKGWKASVLDSHAGQEAGYKSVTLEIDGDLAYGHLQVESGVHRLVRLSPFNAKNLRQTSFASVSVMPKLPDLPEVAIAQEDLRIDTFRASGAGGQHVNKTDSAVRITHVPTGIVASAQSERSQAQNKAHAMTLLKAKLHQEYLDRRVAKEEGLRGEQRSVEWGSQIRSYVLAPYQLVKDHRTNVEEKNTDKVLDGDLDLFVEAALRARV